MAASTTATTASPRFLDRDAEILALARGRRVLHLGCVGHTDADDAERIHRAPETLHWKLSRAGETTGIDNATAVVEGYRAAGVFDNILTGDVEALGALGLNRDYDLIVVADIIEHLSNPGRMLDGVRALCGRETRVVVTTPHAFGLANFVRFLAGRFREGADHVMTFNAQTLGNLLARHGFVVERLDTCHQAAARRRPLAFALGRAVFAWWPKLGGTLFVVARAA